MKECFKCKEVKPLSEFYRHSQMADGRLNKCKGCAKADSYRRRHNSESREAILQYDRKRGNRQDKSYRDMVYARDPVATKARTALSNAVRDGKIERPSRCSHCSKKCKPHGHHHDYTLPLDVIWLCPACHSLLHAFMDTVEKYAQRKQA